MHINGMTIYPDLVIRSKRDGKIFVWEHFGLISNDEYRRKMYRRLEELHAAGFNLWDNLLISFGSWTKQTKSNPKGPNHLFKTNLVSRVGVSSHDAIIPEQRSDIQDKYTNHCKAPCLKSLEYATALLSSCIHFTTDE